jgi:hypothetical protein
MELIPELALFYFIFNLHKFHFRTQIYVYTFNVTTMFPKKLSFLKKNTEKEIKSSKAGVELK